MYVLKRPLSVDLQQKVDEFVISITSCLSFNHYFIKYFKLLYTKKCGYGNFNHRYNVSPLHLQTLFGVGILRMLSSESVVHVCADRL
jgi:hypothetical protein